MTRLTAAEYRQSQRAKQNKYRAKKTVVDGITFDSKREAAYYGELKIREKAGEVSGVELQRSFALIGPDGSLICTYKADFCFLDHQQDSRFRVVDTKGVITPEFRLKKKLMRSLLGIEVEVVK